MTPVAPVTLAGKHVRLVPLTLEHVPALLRAATEGRMTYAFSTIPNSEASMLAYVESALQTAAAGLALPFATLHGDRVVGSTRFGNIEYWDWPLGHPERRPPGVPDAVEIGWTWLAASAQRTSVNTEAKLLLLTHAFETWEVRRVTLKTDERNVRSRAAIERLGAHLDGILRAHMPAADGSVRTSAIYSLLAAEWPEVRDRLRARLDRGALRP